MSAAPSEFPVLKCTRRRGEREEECVVAYAWACKACDWFSKLVAVVEASYRRCVTADAVEKLWSIKASDGLFLFVDRNGAKLVKMRGGASAELPLYGPYVLRGEAFYLFDIDGVRRKVAWAYGKPDKMPDKLPAPAVACDAPEICPIEYWGLIRREDYEPVWGEGLATYVAVAGEDALIAEPIYNLLPVLKEGNTLLVNKRIGGCWRAWSC
jgi:hypothetical protein